jgi:hypothetical protein
MFGILKGHTPDGAMYFVAFCKKELGKIRPILPGDSGYQRTFAHWLASTLPHTRQVYLFQP